MAVKFLPAEKLNGWLLKLREKALLIAPVKEKDGFIRFKPAPQPAEIELTFLNTVNSLREYFSPQSETLFSFSLEKDKFTLSPESLPARDLIFLGVRLCDALSLRLLDKVYGGEYPDPFYRERRKHSLLIGYFCPNPQPTCFCESLSGLLSGSGGGVVDLLLYPLKEGFLLESFSAAGELLLSEFNFMEASPKLLEEKEQLKKLSAKKVSTSLDLKKVPPKLAESFSSPVWEEEAERCLSCGICSFLCPTCQCFQVLDEKQGEQGERFRCWDTCQFPAFAKMAGGINPRQSAAERLKHRIYHKFSYGVSRYGEILCTGCGRCIRHCPVNIDLLAIFNRLLKEGEGGKKVG